MMLEAKTVRIEVDGILRYATPLLCYVKMPLLHGPKESVMPMLRSSERRLLKDPTLAEAYKNEMQKLIESGAVWEVTQDVTLKEECQPDDILRFTVENCFYVDNCLQSVRTPSEAKITVDQLRDLMDSAGFELHQWACNDPSVLSHLPQEARSETLDLWLAQDESNPLESTLGLSWNWEADSLGYKHRPLWDKQRGWDDPNLPAELLQAWSTWEDELRFLPFITFPRAYVPVGTDLEGDTHEVHIFADASEQVYGAVAYMRSEDHEGQVHLSFILAHTREAPKCLHSIPRLELCAALMAAQLSHVLEREVARTELWSDSTTVLTWLHSQSCRYKVFVGTRVAEIQELTENCTWRYVDSTNNPADDLTIGKTLEALTEPNRWSQGPPFLLQIPDTWPERPNTENFEPKVELWSRWNLICITQSS
ncbi:hypothetical protein AOLI_G00217190 [Acnodon oligacanthus]